MTNKMPGLYKVGKAILGPIFKRYYRPVILGAENIPKEGNAIIAGNHIHLYDQCHVIVSTKRPIFYMAKKEYFDDKKVAWFFRLAGCISVDRSKKDEDAKSKAIEVLNNNHASFVVCSPSSTLNEEREKILKDKLLCKIYYENPRQHINLERSGGGRSCHRRRRVPRAAARRGAEDGRRRGIRPGARREYRDLLCRRDLPFRRAPALYLRGCAAPDRRL